MSELSTTLSAAEAMNAEAKTLSHHPVPRWNPFDSYPLLGELFDTQSRLADTYERLAQWHERVELGREHAGEDPRGGEETPANLRAAHALRAAAAAAQAARDALAVAHSANGVIRWFETTREDAEAE